VKEVGMGTLEVIGKTWDRHCRRLEPQEAGALWCLVGMALCSRVRGVVKARWGVVAAAMNTDPERAERAVRGLAGKGSVTVSAAGFGEEAVVITVKMFSDVWERARARERARKGTRT
jgi:hypothetical protein